MSKLYSEYQKLKKINNQKLYLFKSGIFYICLEDDAKKLSEMFEFKITNLNDTIIKCGFPNKRLEFYTNLLKQNKIDFEVIDKNYNQIENFSDYLNNENMKEIINSIASLDMNELSFREAFDFLYELNTKLKKTKF